MKSMGRGLVTVAALLAGMAQAQDCREQLPQILKSAYPPGQHVSLEASVCKVWPARPDLTLVAVPLPRAEHDGYGETDLDLDAHGLPVAFDITGGEINDCTAAPELIAQLPSAEVIVADKGYDSERLRQQIEVQGARPVIPRKRNSIKGNADLDRELYRYRHLVENAFARLKHYRAVAFRFDKLKRNYESVIAMACAFLWLPM